MRWKNVKLIFHRELRDQLRDRRTLFMIAVLPLLLYPLMGMALLQIAQLRQVQPTKVWLIGSSHLPDRPVLLEDGQIVASLFSSPDRAHLIDLDVAESLPEGAESIEKLASEVLAEKLYDAVVYFPPTFATEIEKNLSVEDVRFVPRPQVFFSGAREKSRTAYDRIVLLLDRWRGEIVQRTLAARQIPPSAAEPFEIGDQDVAEETKIRAALWSKVLPFIVIVWALTGAFYPAIDLCAGEKERGTLETLLSSPAERLEIVWGKLLTVMLFSIATSILNVISVTATAAVIMARLGQYGAADIPLGPPPLSTMGWLLLALVPLAALFSALSLACATMARSSKEGQYYLMPLLLVTMPLAMIPVLPATEISLGGSLVPVTGVMFLLRSLMEGDYLVALKFAVPVIAVTGICCMLAIRWAVHQFNDESVLFRESERFDISSWVRHLVRDRADTPSVAEAVMCGILLLLLQFFVRFVAPPQTSWWDIVVSTSVLQVGLVVAPVLLMTTMLTASPRKTLLLRLPPLSAMLAAIVLALCLHPAAVGMREVLHRLYPISPETKIQLTVFAEMIHGVPLWQIVLLLAVTPAICEELAFRGFILSGLRHLGSRGMAILISSLFFGIVHGVLQQSLNAFVLGLILGYVAVHSGSILPCMLFHGVHNAMQLGMASTLTSDFLSRNPQMARFLTDSAQIEGALVYRTPILIVSILASGLVLYWFRSLPYSLSAEEQLQDALDHQSSAAGSLG